MYFPNKYLVGSDEIPMPVKQNKLEYDVKPLCHVINSSLVFRICPDILY